MKENYELYNRIQNEKRKKLLVYIYEQPRNYTRLIEFSSLKPGSLYHHLSILEPLIEKRGHGLYAITELGSSIVENMKLVDLNTRKPSIHKSSELISGYTEIQDTEGIENSLSGEVQIVTELENLPPWNDRLALIWLGNSNYLLIGLTLSIIILLGIQGISLAGSAIYVVGDTIVFLFDIVAFILGMVSLYYIELFQVKYKVYNRVKFIFTIRLISMLPGVIVGISLLLLYLADRIPATSIYPWIFGMTIFLGTITAAIGIHYLRGQPFNDSLLIATVPGVIDLLLGIIVLIA